MMKSTFRLLLVFAILAVAPGRAAAQKLIELLPGLYGGDGILLATAPAASHEAHFSIQSAASINRLNKQIAAEVGGFPVSSAIGGFSFEFDPVVGDFVSTAKSLGPIMAERATTQGRGRANLSLSWTYLNYSEFGGRDLGSFDVAALHDPDIVGFPDTHEQFEQDVVVIGMDIDLSAQVLALAATYGVTDNLDVSALVPYAMVDMDVVSNARVAQSELNTLFPEIHSFEEGADDPNDRASGSASGIGDVMLRGKYHLLERDGLHVAGGAQVQFGTADEEDFLGTGDTTVRPYVVLSRTFGIHTPHVNIGYEWNLDRGSHSAMEYAFGFDSGNNRYTLAAEFLGSHELDGDGIGDDVVDTAVGVKWNAGKSLLIGVNGRVPVNDAGLRSALTTTVSAEYGF